MMNRRSRYLANFLAALGVVSLLATLAGLAWHFPVVMLCCLVLLAAGTVVWRRRKP